jgi:hypothetical protein
MSQLREKVAIKKESWLAKLEYSILGIEKAFKT